VQGTVFAGKAQTLMIEFGIVETWPDEASEDKVGDESPILNP
jgi:hypothetical protein